MDFCQGTVTSSGRENSQPTPEVSTVAPWGHPCHCRNLDPTERAFQAEHILAY